MATKKFPFISFEPGAPAMPLVPFDFPKGKSVYCLVDSGASSSFISEDFARHEELGFKKPVASDLAEGICGNRCLSILGVTEDAEVGVDGFSRSALLEFRVIAKRHKLDRPVIGQNFLRFFKVCFVRESGGLFTVISD